MATAHIQCNGKTLHIAITGTPFADGKIHLLGTEIRITAGMTEEDVARAIEDACGAAIEDRAVP